MEEYLLFHSNSTFFYHSFFARPFRDELLDVLGRSSVQQSEHHSLEPPEEGDEIGHHAHDCRPRLSHLQRSAFHRQHHGALHHQLQATHR